MWTDERRRAGVAGGSVLTIALLFYARDACAQDQQVGARTKAMGGSYTAFEDDPISIWLNPAGIAPQSDGGCLTYQTHTIYEVEIKDDPTEAGVPAEVGWTDPAIVPSFLGAVFQIGSPDRPQAIGICFTTPFRMEFAYDAPGGLVEPAMVVDQAFYRIRAAYAHGFRFKPVGGEGFLTHLSLGAGLDVNVTSWESREQRSVSVPLGPPARVTNVLSGKDVGFGGGLGLLLGVYDNTRNLKLHLGGAYQSQANYDFSVDNRNVPLFDWPNQFELGATLYLLEGLPLRFTVDAQLIAWDEASRDSQVPGMDSFRDVTNYSAGAEYRLALSDTLALYPRAGLRLYNAPWADADRLPAVGIQRLLIDTRDDRFVIGSLGVGIAWSGESGRMRQVDVAMDYGGDAPGLALSIAMEF